MSGYDAAVKDADELLKLYDNALTAWAVRQACECESCFKAAREYIRSLKESRRSIRDLIVDGLMAVANDG